MKMKMQEIQTIIQNLKKYFNEKVGDANITTDDYTNGFDKWMEQRGYCYVTNELVFSKKQSIIQISKIINLDSYDFESYNHVVDGIIQQINETFDKAKSKVDECHLIYKFMLEVVPCMNNPIEMNKNDYDSIVVFSSFVIVGKQKKGGMKTISTFTELDEFLNDNKDFCFYIANPMRRKFIKFDKEYMPQLDCYLIKSDEQEISLVDVKLKKIEIIKVDIKDK